MLRSLKVLVLFLLFKCCGGILTNSFWHFGKFAWSLLVKVSHADCCFILIINIEKQEVVSRSLTSNCVMFYMFHLHRNTQKNKVMRQTIGKLGASRLIMFWLDTLNWHKTRFHLVSLPMFLLSVLSYANRQPGSASYVAYWHVSDVDFLSWI